MNKRPIAFVFGSDSDLPQFESAFKLLEELQIGFHVRILSAHRTPEEATGFAREAQENGISVLIGVAGLAAHLAGALAAHSNLPVLGVPAETGPLQGHDALLSTVMMPPGIPVGTLGIGKSGARNAALLAARIVALGDAALAKRLATMRDKQRTDTLEKDQSVRDRFGC